MKITKRIIIASLLTAFAIAPTAYAKTRDTAEAKRQAEKRKIEQAVKHATRIVSDLDGELAKLEKTAELLKKRIAELEAAGKTTWEAENLLEEVEAQIEDARSEIDDTRTTIDIANSTTTTSVISSLKDSIKESEGSLRIARRSLSGVTKAIRNSIAGKVKPEPEQPKAETLDTGNQATSTATTTTQ